MYIKFSHIVEQQLFHHSRTFFRFLFFSVHKKKCDCITIKQLAAKTTLTLATFSNRKLFPYSADEYRKALFFGHVYDKVFFHYTIHSFISILTKFRKLRTSECICLSQIMMLLLRTNFHNACMFSKRCLITNRLNKIVNPSML
jgi:hypothetical protein